MSTPSWAIEYTDGMGAILPFQEQCDPGPCGLAIGAPESWGGATPFEPWRFYSTWEEWAATVNACLACWPYDDEQVGEIRAGLARSKDCWPCKDRAKTVAGSFVLPGVAARLQQAGINPQATPWLASQGMAAPSPAELSTLAQTYISVAPPSQGGQGAPGTGAWTPGSAFLASMSNPPVPGSPPVAAIPTAPAGPVTGSSPSILGSSSGIGTATSGGVSILGYHISTAVLVVIAIGAFLVFRR